MTSFAVNTNRRSGFTLAEILLAMLVFAIAITTILALLARSIETVDDIVLKDEAMRLSSAVERELGNKPFSDLYNLVRATSAENPLEINAFHYRASPDAIRTPEPDRNETDVVIVPFVRERGASTPTGGIAEASAFAARDGRFFRVLIQVSPTNPEGTSLPNTSDAYPSAALVLFARFIPIGGPNLGVPANPRDVYSYNFAVRR